MSALTQAMTEYGQAIRVDWSGFDGRSERAVIASWVREIETPDPAHDIEWWRREVREIETPDPAHDIEWWRRELGICMTGGGHWCGRWGYCDADCGCPCGAEP